MRRLLIFIYFFLITRLIYSQVGIGIYTGVIVAFRFGGDNWSSLSTANFLTPISGGLFTINSSFPVTYYNQRSMFGVGAFLNNTDFTTQGQLSQKYMTFRQLGPCNLIANTLRIAWRYNVHNDSKYELGLYSHKNHTAQYAYCFQPKINSREVAYTDIRVNKFELFNYQLIFGRSLSAVRIWAQGKDQTIMLHRASSFVTWPSPVTITDAEAQLYASRDQNTPNHLTMLAYSSAITLPVYFELPYYHTNIFLLDCVFSANQNKTLTAKSSISYPAKNYTNQAGNYQPIPPNPSYVPPFCVIESGSNVTFKANNFIKIEDGFRVQVGGVISIGQ